MIAVPKLVRNNDKLYAVRRTIPETNEIDPKWFKYKLGVDHVFKANGNFWFVDEVKDAVIIPNLQQELEFPN